MAQEQEQQERDEPRATNDSRKRPTVAPKQAKPVEKKPSLGQKWRAYQPSKMVLVWACIGSIILTVVVGFTWGGWMTANAATETAETMAKDAVIERLAPICSAQFDADPDKAVKLDEMAEMTTSASAKYVQEQGWATISGNDKPDRKVATACAQLILAESP